MMRGERGERGDPGHEGPRGVEGGVDPDDLDRLVVKVTGEALKESHVKAWDLRLVLIFGMVVGGLLLFGWVDDRRDERRDAEFRKAVVAVCEKTNRDNTRVNEALEQLAQAALRSEGFPPDERIRRADGYRQLFLSITECPPGQ